MNQTIKFCVWQTSKKTAKEQIPITEAQKQYHYTIVDASVADIAEHISNGRCFRPAIHKEAKTFTATNALSVQIVALDFDDNPETPQQCIDRLLKMGMPTPNIWYYTFSNGLKGNCPRYRIIWILDTPVPAHEFNDRMDVLRKGIPECDQACFKAERAWFGTNQQVEVLNHSLTALKIFSKFWDLGNNNIYEVPKFAITDSSVEDTIYCSEDETNFYDGITVEVPDNWDILLAKNLACWNDFINGKYVDYNTRRWIFSGLKYLHNKRNPIKKRVIQIFHDNPTTWAGHTLSDDQIKTLFSKNKKINTMVAKAKYFDDGFLYTIPDYFKLIYKQTDARKKEIENLSMENYMNENVFTYIQAQTGAGKTQAMIEWIFKQDLSKQKIIYSLPEYINIDETYHRMRAVEGTTEEFSKIHRLTPKKYKDEDMILMYLGLPATTKNKGTEREAFMKALMDEEHGGVFLTTHKFILCYPIPIPNVMKFIIDENIEEAMVETIEITVDGLQNVMRYTANPSACDNLIASMATCHQWGQRFDISSFGEAVKQHFDINKYISENGNRLQPALFRLIYCNTLIARGDGTFFTIRKAGFAYENANIVLMTATPLPAYLKLMFKDIPFIHHTTPRACNVGNITTYCGLSGARKGTVDDRIAYVKQLMNEGYIKKDSVVLAFKDEEKAWTDAGFELPYYDGKLIHIANCAGLDCLKGKNIVIAGKYDVNPNVFRDIYAWNNPTATEPPHACVQTVMTQRGLLKIWTYDDPDLQDYHLQHMEYAIGQAVGRARALREPAEVAVIGNYPVMDNDKCIRVPYKGK